MEIVILYFAALFVLALMPGWKSYGVVFAATCIFLVVIFIDPPASPCSGHAACGGAMAGYLLKGPIMMAFWFVFLLVAGLKAWRLAATLQPRR